MHLLRSGQVSTRCSVETQLHNHVCVPQEQQQQQQQQQQLTRLVVVSTTVNVRLLLCSTGCALAMAIVTISTCTVGPKSRTVVEASPCTYTVSYPSTNAVMRKLCFGGRGDHQRWCFCSWGAQQLRFVQHRRNLGANSVEDYEAFSAFGQRHGRFPSDQHRYPDCQRNRLALGTR